jgi:hypothetical protein
LQRNSGIINPTSVPEIRFYGKENSCRAAILHLKWYILGVIVLLAAGLSKFSWLRHGTDTTEGIATGNGCIEAVEVDITTRYSGRLIAILAKEGDMPHKKGNVYEFYRTRYPLRVF